MSSCMSKYIELQQFASVKEMDQYVRNIKKHFAKELNQTAKDVLDFLARHSCKVKGVSLLKVETIAKGIGKSERTIRSVTSLLKKIGVVDKLSQTREKKGGDGANVYVIKSDCIADCRAEIAGGDESEILTAPSQEPTESDTEAFSLKAPSKSLKAFKKIETRAREQKISSVDKCDSRLYADIPAMIKISLGRLKNNRFANSLWKKIIQAYSRSSLRHLFPRHQLQEMCAIDDEFSNRLYAKIHNAVHDYNAGDITKSIEGYLYRVCANFFQDESSEYEREFAPARGHASQIPFYDWLSA